MRYKLHKQYRLPHYDYGSNGAYFVTICTFRRRCVFGKIKNGVVQLSPVGKIAYNFWKEIPAHFPYVVLDEFVIMPNHVHGIIIIDNPANQPNPTGPRREISIRRNDKSTMVNDISGRRNGKLMSVNDISICRIGRSTDPTGLQPQPQSLSIVIRNYKTAVTTAARRLGLIHTLWQSRFYDHIIRNERSFRRIQSYIRDNPIM